MKKITLLFTFAAFLFGGAFLKSCQTDDFQLDGDFQMAVISGNYYDDACETECINEGGPYFVKTYEDNFGQPQRVYVDIYNTTTQLIYRIYTANTSFKYLYLDNVKVVDNVATTEYVYTVDLGTYGDDWDACELYELEIEVYKQTDKGSGAGNKIVFETEYKLIGVCDGDDPGDCTWYGETAWAAGTRYTNRGNWATFTPYAEGTVNLLAGQKLNAGTVAFPAVVDGEVTITITLTAGWRFKDDYENVKIQDYATAPSGNPAPGLFAYKGKGAGMSFMISVPANNFYGVHVDVEQCRQ